MWHIVCTYSHVYIFDAIQLFWCYINRFMIITIFQQVNQLPSTPYHSAICICAAFKSFAWIGMVEKDRARATEYINISNILTALFAQTVRQIHWHKVHRDLICWCRCSLFLLHCCCYGLLIGELSYPKRSSICNIKHNHLFEIHQLFVYD